MSDASGTDPRAGARRRGAPPPVASALGAPTHHTVRVAGAGVHVVEASPPAPAGGPARIAPPVVLLAGWPQTWYAWRAVLPLLGASRRTVALDLPGQGDSEPSTRGYTTEAAADDVRDALDALGLGVVDLVGHDVGGWVAYALAAAYPGRVRRLAILESGIPGVANPQGGAFSEASNHKSWHFGFNQLEGLPEALVTGRERAYLEWFFRAKSVRPGALEALDEYERAYARPGAMSRGWAYYRAYHASARHHQALAARPLAGPVLALGGEASMGDAQARIMAKLAGDVRSVVVPDAGHYVPEEQPAAVAAALRDFLDAPDPGPAVPPGAGDAAG